MAPKTRRGVALALFLGAFLLRLLGIGWGLRNDLHDASYHPDEPVVLAYSQQIQPLQGKFTPGFYNYGTLYLTELKIASDVVSGYTGAPDTKDPASVAAWVSRAHVGGRVLSALAGAVIPAAVFLGLLPFLGAAGALVAALVPSLAAGLVVHSRFQTVDLTATMWFVVGTMLALAPLVPGIAERTLRRRVVFAGVAFGLAAATKYTGVLGFVSLFVAAFAAPWPGRWRDVALAGVATVVVFLVSVPGVLLDREAFVRDFVYELGHTATGHGLVFEGTSNGFLYHVGNLFAGVGPVLTTLGIAGLLLAAGRRHRWAWVVGAGFLVTYVAIGRAEVKFLRYTFPLTLGVAAGVGWLFAAGHRRGGAYRTLPALAIAGLGFDGLVGSARATIWMAGEDPRDAAARAIRAAGPPSVGLVSDPWFYTVPLWRGSADSRMVPKSRRWQDAQTARPPVLFAVAEDGTVRPFDLRLLEEQRPAAVAFSSFESDDLERLSRAGALRPDVQSQVDAYRAFRRRLEADYRLANLYGSDAPPVHDLMYVHPRIEVWRRR